VGKALKAKDLTSKGVQSETDDTLKHVITAGVGSMPAFGTKLTPEQIDGMVKMVRSLAADKPAGAPAK
jgi:mono/diheme cytochrome c family protein